MYQAPLPPEYADLSAEETHARIQAAKATLGPKVVILGHHYQRDEIIEHADFRGDLEEAEALHRRLGAIRSGPFRDGR